MAYKGENESSQDSFEFWSFFLGSTCDLRVAVVVVVIALVVVDWFGKTIKMSKITQIYHQSGAILPV